MNFVLCDLTIAEACKVTVFLWHIMLFHVDWIKLHRVMPQKRVPLFIYFLHTGIEKNPILSFSPTDSVLVHLHPR